MPALKQDRYKRFWKKVNKNGPKMPHMRTRCWVWTAAKFPPLGYGAFQDEGKALRAHRVSFAMKHGPIPAEHDVLHHCDNPPCVRGSHLFLGDQAANNQDRDSKSRQASGNRHGSRTKPQSRPRGRKHWMRMRPHLIPRGEKTGSAKLTNRQAAKMRREYVPYKVSYTILAIKYGVHPETVGRVIRGEHY